MRSQWILHFFRSHILWAHRAVIFATALLSCSKLNTWHCKSVAERVSQQKLELLLIKSLSEKLIILVLFAKRGHAQCWICWIFPGGSTSEVPKAPRSRRRRRRGGEVWGRGDSLPSRPNPNPNPNPRRPPHSHLTPPIRGTPANIPRNLIYPETRIIGLHFCRRLHGSILIQICTMGSKTRIFACCNRVLAEVGFWRQIAAQGPSRSCILQ